MEGVSYICRLMWRFCIFLLICFTGNVSNCQIMDPEKNISMGIRAGVTVSWLLNPEIASRQNLSRYQPTPRQGIGVGIYLKGRMNKFIKAFNPLTDVKNWYFISEIGCAYRGGNYRFYNAILDTNGLPLKENGKITYQRSDTGDFRKISNFVIDLPLLLCWDIGNKGKTQILFGGNAHFIGFTELFRGNDYSPLYVGNALPSNYYDLVRINRWGASAMAGIQLSGEYAGFQCMLRYGITQQNHGIVTKLNPQTNRPLRIMPGTLTPISIDFSVVF